MCSQIDTLKSTCTSAAGHAYFSNDVISTSFFLFRKDNFFMMVYILLLLPVMVCGTSAQSMFVCVCVISRHTVLLKYNITIDCSHAGAGYGACFAYDFSPCLYQA